MFKDPQYLSAQLCVTITVVCGALKVNPVFEWINILKGYFNKKRLQEKGMESTVLGIKN